MSCLRLYSPQRFSLYAPSEPAPYESELRVMEESDESGPVILRFPVLHSALDSADGSSAQALLERTRVIHKNRCCPECGRATAIPVDQEQQLHSLDHMPIPGAGALAGFQCLRCDHTWSV